MIIGCIIIGLILFFLAFAFIPMRFGVRYLKTSSEEKIHIYVSIFGMLLRIPFHNKRKEKVEKKQAKSPSVKTFSLQTFQETIDAFNEIYQVSKDELLSMISYVRKHLSCKEIDFRIRYGTDNAATTGYLTGAIWTSGTLLLKIIDSLIGVKKIKMDVNPDFNGKKIEIYAKTILIMQPFRFIIIVKKVMATIAFIQSKLN